MQNNPAEVDDRCVLPGVAIPVGSAGITSVPQRNNNQGVRMHQSDPGRIQSHSDSSTQTSRRLNHSAEEKVIWRLRTRVHDVRTNSSPSPTSQVVAKPKKVALKVPVVTQSPGFGSQRRPLETTSPRFNQKRPPGPAYSSTSLTNLSEKCESSRREVEPSAQPPESHNALSKVVAVATAAPTHIRPTILDTKSNSSSQFPDDHNLLTAG
uniref:Uncharacterized protein n=1 Tax=Ciona savignyi TaxID=51511 RepID=H2ZJA5_CIOSA